MEQSGEIIPGMFSIFPFLLNDWILIVILLNTGFESPSIKNGKLQYRFNFFGSCPCYKTKIPAHMISSGHKDKHNQMSATLSATATRCQMPNSYSFPLGEVQSIVDLIINEAMASGV